MLKGRDFEEKGWFGNSLREEEEDSDDDEYDKSDGVGE